jgi:prepilin-type N-terminal cleavage/methylation domain-containing protein
MASHNISMLSRSYRTLGFSLLEVTVVVALVSLIASLPIIFSFDAYRQNARLSEVATIQSLFETARSRALVNRAGLSQGVAFVSTGYVLFMGDSFATSNPATREFIASSYSLQRSTTTPSQVVFSARSGTTTPDTYEFIDTSTEHSSVMSVNYEGLIQ